MGARLQDESANAVARACDWSRPDCPDLRLLLDHVAEELAKEYVRLMEAWADREAGK